jgi:hypothetical protein
MRLSFTFEHIISIFLSLSLSLLTKGGNFGLEAKKNDFHLQK